ncbi:S49 family peptidase [Tessaracoccus antarcticus]|uniref:S49 family peptidase n=1 Tax=Tessaracoccus antarcticus TaxID=2479848 RepID=A0A3M0G4M8_9ACTN|nr:S49 family peptidase [Tessaracoccus antarcticus]RMB59805.1 S49 family peptidase [Tessaracoccus antarcticus]
MDDTPTPTPAAPPNFPPPEPAALATEAPRAPGPFKRGFGMGAGLGLGLAVTFVALAVVTGVFALISTAMALGSITSSGASTSLSTLWGKTGASGKLRALSISGPIMTDASEGGLLVAGTFGYELAEQIDAITKDDAAGLVLLVNTPGGSITGSKAIADAIDRYQERTGKKVLVHVEGMSASGGVYSTAPADAIYADHGSIVGSIGVIFGPFQRFRDVVATSGSFIESGVTTTGGITQEYISAGTGKDFGNPFRDMTDAERQMITTMLDTEYDNFVGHVAEQRDIPQETIVNELGAQVFGNDDAERVGLIDGTLNREEFFRKAAVEAGLDPEETVVQALQPPTGLEALLGASRPAGSALPIAELGEGHRVSTSFCGGGAPLVYAGDLAGVCS